MNDDFPRGHQVHGFIEFLPECTELTGLLGFREHLDGEIDLLLGHISFVFVLVLTQRLDHHRRIHDADGRNVEYRCLAFEFRIEQFVPVAYRATDQIRPDAESIRVINRRNQRQPVGLLACEVAIVLGRKVHDLDGRGPLVTDLLAVDLTLGKDRSDIVGLLDASSVHTLQVSGRHNLLHHPDLGLENIETVRLRDGRLHDIVGCQRYVLNIDSGIFPELVRNAGILRHRGAGVA